MVIFMKKISNTSARLQEYIDLTGLKQVDILDRCKPYEDETTKITKTHLSQYISGKIEPKQKRLEVLAKALDVDEVWLMGYDVPMKETSHDDFRQEMFDEERVLFDYKHLSESSKETVRNIIKALKSQDENQKSNDD